MADATRTSSPEPKIDPQETSSMQLANTDFDDGLQQRNDVFYKPTSLTEHADSTSSQKPTLTQSEFPSSTHDDLSSDNASQRNKTASDTSSSKTITPDSTLPQKSTAGQPEASSPQHMVPHSPSRAMEMGAQNGNSSSDGISQKLKDVQIGNNLMAASPHLLTDPPSNTPESQNDKLPFIDSLSLEKLITLKVGELLSHSMKREPKFTQKRQIASPELCIGKLSQEEFKSSTPPLRKNPNKSGHFVSDPPSRPLYVIEVLMKESVASEPYPRRIRIRNIEHTSRAGTVTGNSIQAVPDRIRIRSVFLLNLLHQITNVRLDHDDGETSVNERTSLMFLYPYKFFMTYRDKIEAEANRLETKFNDDGKPGQSYTSTKLSDDVTVDSPAQMSKDASIELVSAMKDDYKSKNAFNHLKLVKELLGTYLRPLFELRKAYRNAIHETVSFRDLWLLFEVGELVFYREPLPDHPPSIVRMMNFNGGRQLLNNSEFKTQEPRRDVQGPNSKGNENRFFLRHYHLNFDGEYYDPVENILTIPPWQGTRSVYDLKLFSLKFCRNFIDHRFGSLDDFKNHVIGRGREFVKLDAIDRRFYDGKVIGTPHEFFSSSIMINFKLQRRDTEPRSGLLSLMESVLKSEQGLATGLSIYSDDPREVQKGTLRADSTVECVSPNCDDNDFIHDDILLNNIIAHQKIKSYGVTGAKFSRSDINELLDVDYTLFPSFIQGYVLNNRVWAKLDLDLVTNIRRTGSKFDALHIPSGHKDSLIALVDMFKNRFSQLELDIMPGKGQGIIILLHDRPGLGKTATAEAMAVDMKKENPFDHQPQHHHLLIT